MKPVVVSTFQIILDTIIQSITAVHRTDNYTILRSLLMNLAIKIKEKYVRTSDQKKGDMREHGSTATRMEKC